MKIYQRSTADYGKDGSPEAQLELRTAAYLRTLESGFKACRERNRRDMERWPTEVGIGAVA